MKTIGVVGSRKRDGFKDFVKVARAFFKVYEEGDVICSGLCPKGADNFAKILSKNYNIKNLWFPAQWDKYGKSAGFIRNDEIAKHSSILIACVAPDRKGGTEDTIKKFIFYHGNKRLIIID